MSERTALITGATNGVGRVVAERLGRLGLFVLAHGRDEVRGRDLVAGIAAAGGLARFYCADLASLTEVRRLAGEVATHAPRLPLLINNAGIGFGRPDAERETSADGLELRFAVNYLAPFLLTRLLLPSILAAAPARIVNVASIGQQDLDFLRFAIGAQLFGRRCPSPLEARPRHATLDLAAELAQSWCCGECRASGAFMDTFMVREAGGTPMSTVEDGADAIMHLAVSPQMADRTGLFFDRLTPARARAQAYDATARATPRRLSFESAGLPPEAA